VHGQAFQQAVEELLGKLLAAFLKATKYKDTLLELDGQSITSELEGMHELTNKSEEDMGNCYLPARVTNAAIAVVPCFRRTVK
jgi:hypothetical protein